VFRRQNLAATLAARNLAASNPTASKLLGILMMFKPSGFFVAVLLLTMPGWSEQVAQSALPRENVAVTATSKRVSATDVDLTVRATIESALHIGG